MLIVAWLVWVNFIYLKFVSRFARPLIFGNVLPVEEYFILIIRFPFNINVFWTDENEWTKLTVRFSANRIGKKWARIKNKEEEPNINQKE